MFLNLHWNLIFFVLDSLCMQVFSFEACLHPRWLFFESASKTGSTEQWWQTCVQSQLIHNFTTQENLIAFKMCKSYEQKKVIHHCTSIVDSQSRGYVQFEVESRGDVFWGWTWRHSTSNDELNLGDSTRWCSPFTSFDDGGKNKIMTDCSGVKWSERWSLLAKSSGRRRATISGRNGHV